MYSMQPGSGYKYYIMKMLNHLYIILIRMWSLLVIGFLLLIACILLIEDKYQVKIISVRICLGLERWFISYSMYFTTPVEDLRSISNWTLLDGSQSPVIPALPSLDPVGISHIYAHLYTYIYIQFKVDCFWRIIKLNLSFLHAHKSSEFCPRATGILQVLVFGCILFGMSVPVSLSLA